MIVGGLHKIREDIKNGIRCEKCAVYLGKEKGNRYCSFCISNGAEYSNPYIKKQSGTYSCHHCGLNRNVVIKGYCKNCYSKLKEWIDGEGK